MSIVAIIVASVVWFIVASGLFFNPIIDKIYRSQDNQGGARSLPKTAKSVGMIISVILIQVVLWAWVYSVISSVLPGDKLEKGLIFGLILIATKMIPRDTDRILLSKYPQKRMLIEFVIGCISMMVVGTIFGYLG